MQHKVYTVAAVTLLLTQISAPAAAMHGAAVQGQTAGVVAGATVYDAQGAEVGKIESVAGGSAVVFTGSNRATIPVTSFGTSPKGPTLGMTRAQLDAASSQAAAAATAQLRARLAPETEVRGKAGTVLGRVKALHGDNVVLSTPKGEVRVPISGVGVNAQGVFIGMTQAEFDAAVSAGAANPG